MESRSTLVEKNGMKKLTLSNKDYGRVDSLRHVVLQKVADEDYARAIEELELYTEEKSDFPQFKERSERYVQYCRDLVNGIKAKRSFPGFTKLGMSKQQELYDRAVEHFEDLKATLRKIEQIDQEVKVEDIRSTVWIIRALVHSVAALLIVAFIKEMSHGVLPTAGIVIDDAFGRLTNFIFDTLRI